MDGQVQQFKEFLQLYNTITEKCFNSCVTNFFDRSLHDSEEFCIKNCVDKFANVNQVIMKTYVEVQGEINEKRMQEYNQNLLKQEELLKEQAEQQIEQPS